MGKTCYFSIHSCKIQAKISTGTTYQPTNGDRWLGYGMIVVTVLVVMLAVLPQSLPYEDAAILFRYAAHIGQGNGWVWNVGEKPIDGSTDFLFTFILGQLHRLGLSIASGSFWLALLSIIGSAALIWRFVLRQAGRLWAVLATVWFLTGPIWLYVVAGFATPFAIFVVLWLWSAHHRSLPNPLKHGIWNGFYTLGAVVTRPDIGIISMLFPFLSGKKNLQEWLILALVAGSGILLYLLVRWIAFDQELFPAPFYVKSASADGGRAAAYYFSGISAWMAFPVIGGIVGLLVKDGWKNGIKMAVILTVWAVLWLFINQETNFYHRYQYPAWTVVLVLGTIQWKHWVKESKTLKIIALSIFTISIGWQIRNLTWDFPYAVTLKDGRATIGNLLHGQNIPESEKVLAATECGLLPYFSEWKTLDALGLNSYRIAKNGLKWEYLDEYQPTVIMYHSDPDQSTQSAENTLEEYAKANHYLHAAAFCATEKDCDHFWVKAGLPQSEALSQAIATSPYYRQWSRKYVPNVLLP